VAVVEDPDSNVGQLGGAASVNLRITVKVTQFAFLRSSFYLPDLSG